MKKFRRIISVIAIVTMFAASSATVSAEENSLKELKNLPYSDSVVLTKDGEVDAAYYENQQRKLFDEFSKQVATQKKLIRTGFSKDMKPTVKHTTIPGDVYVAYTGTLLGVDFALVGHASIVETAGGVWCISSWPAKDGRVNGVQYEYNYWPGKTKIYGLRVKDGTATTRAKAVEAARAYVNKSPRIPYNWNYLNKFTTEKFYCSQLVWRCWKTAGIDIDRMPYDTVVSPAELTGPKMTLLFSVD